jgi:hypothetical protein
VAAQIDQLSRRRRDTHPIILDEVARRDRMGTSEPGIAGRSGSGKT